MVQQGGEALSSLGIYSMPGILLAIKGRLSSSSLTNILYEEVLRKVGAQSKEQLKRMLNDYIGKA